MPIIITHGLRNNGVNPGHTEEGRSQIAKLVLPYVPSLVLVGTGRRFGEIYQELVKAGTLDPKVPAKLCLFCGSADSFDPPNVIVLASGEACLLEEYMGLTNTPGFDAWAFIKSQPEDTLFLAGGELVTALGIAKPAKGVIYSVDAEAKTIGLAS